MKHRSIFLLALLAIASVSCSMPGDSIYDQSPRAPMVPIPPGVGAGEYTDSMPMLLDPEAESEEWTQEIFASSLADAKTKCQNIANNSGLTEVINVSQKTKSPNSQGNYTFICWFKSEVGATDAAGDDSQY